jgi:carbon-monoxide dehydrogenase large subunit
MLTPTDTHDWRPHDGNSGIGQPVRRKEDLRLVTGQGCFSDDVDLPGQAYAVMVRSPHAHARIRSIDVAPALAVPGVVAVLTGRDLLADRVKPIPHKQWSYHPAEIPLQNKDDAAVFAAAHFPMPADKARFVGEVVAMVIADSVAAAKDGAERVAIDYEPLPAVTQAVASAGPDAPRLWEEAPSNVLIDAEVGNAAATAAAFARAAHVVRLETWIPRVTAVPMEPRAAVASYDAATQRYTVHAGSGGAVRLKTDIAQTLDVPEAAVRVVMRDVGGNFGSRGAIYPEFVLVAARSSGPASGTNPSSAITRAATWRARPSSPSMGPAIFSLCAGRMSAIWARSPRTSRWCRRALRSIPASTACPPPASARAASPATPRRRGPTGAPAGRR